MYLEFLARWSPIISAYNNSMTALEMIKALRKMVDELFDNQCDLDKKMDNLIEWIENSGFQKYVVDELKRLLESGELNDIISHLLVPEIMNKIDGVIDAREYGAVGDGVTDDSESIQKMLDSGYRNLNITNGVYLVDKPLVCNTPGVSIRTHGATIVSTTVDMIVLTTNGIDSYVQVDIDGTNRAAGGVDMYGGNSKLHNSNIENLFGVGIGSFGVRATTRDGVDISSNNFRNISATDNGVIGDNVGSARAILVTNTGIANKQSLITDNKISNILGEEGDAIQVLFYGGTYPMLDGKCTISDNMIHNCNRRGIKVQASNTQVINNVHTNDLGIEQLPTANAVIDLISSHNCMIEGNSIDATLFMGIKTTGQELIPNLNNHIVNNYVKGGNTTGSGLRSNTNAIYVNFSQDCSVVGNVIVDGISAIGVDTATNITVESNVISGGLSTSNAINITASCTKITVRSNTHNKGERSYLISNRASDSVIESNSRLSGDGGLIRTFSTVINTLYKDNTINHVSVPAVVKDSTDGSGVIYVDNINLNPSASPQARFRGFMTQSPEIGDPSKRSARGDYAHNLLPEYNGTVGWVCVGAGTPGLWTTFGVVGNRT